MAATKKTGGRERTKETLAQEAIDEGKVLVRIKAYNPKKGQPLEKYTAFGILFEERKGWYLVDPHVAKYLQNIRARPDVLDHPVFLFDICSQEEATKLAKKEHENAVRAGRASSETTGAVRARDVRTGTQMGPKPGDEPPPGYDLTTDDFGEREPVVIPQRAVRAPKPNER